MAADHDGWKTVVSARTAREHIAHLVDLDDAARRLAPGPEKLAALLVEISQRQALAAALRRAADLRHLHQRVPEARAVDSDIRKVGHRGLVPKISVWQTLL